MRGSYRGEKGSRLAAFPFPEELFELPLIRRRRRLTAICLLATAFVAFGALSAGAQTTPATAQSIAIALLPLQQMSPEHARLAINMQDSVARSAGIYGYTLDSSYDYREIACPFAPHDVLLAYESVSPNGAISRFTAILSPGDSSGRSPVQIIPILHFGVTPFVPAYSSPHSVETFNQAVDAAPVGSAALAEIKAGRAPIVLRGLCYLAMVGAEPSALRSPSLEAATFQAPVPTLQFLEKGRTRQLISIRSSATTYQVWALAFSSGGRLMAASREERPVDRTPQLLEAATPASTPSLSTPAVAASNPPVPSPPMERPAAAMSPESQPAAPVAPAPISAPSAAAASASRESESPATSAPGAVSAVSQPAAVAAPPPVTSSAVIAESPMAQPALPAKEAVVAPPVPATPLAPVAATMVTPPSPSTMPAAPAANSLRATQIMIPEPPHRFIPDPPPPPRRFIPGSALQTPPHLSQ
jgi:hypothetical protein